MALTDTAIHNAKPKEKLFKLYDARGLYIEITPKGAKRWRFRYRRPGTGKESRLSLGIYPDVSLKEARIKRDEARKMLDDGVDPSSARQAEKHLASKVAANTFQAVAEDWRENYLIKKSSAHLKRTWSIVSRCLLPYIGKRPISEITALDLLAPPQFGSRVM